MAACQDVTYHLFTLCLWVCVSIFVAGRLWSTMSVGHFCAQTAGSSYTLSFTADCISGQAGQQDGIARLRVLVSKTRRNRVRLILGNTSFDIGILKPYGSQIQFSELGSLTVLQVSEIHPASQTCSLPVFISEKMPKQLGDELSIYLFITNVSLTWRNVVRWKSLFCHSCYLLSSAGVTEDLKVIWKAAFCSLSALSILASSSVLQSHHY